MSAVSLAQPVAATPARGASGGGASAKTGADSGPRSFAALLGDDAPDAEPNTAGGDAKDGITAADKRADPSSDQPADPAAADAKGLLDFLQALLGTTNADANVKPGAPGNTPPTQAQPPSDAEIDPGFALSARQSPQLPNVEPAAGADDDASAAFTLSALKANTADAPSALTPAQSAALAAAVAATPAAAPEAVVRAADTAQPATIRVDAAPAFTAQAATVFTPLATPILLSAPLALDHADLPARLGERVQWLADSGVQEARLQLHPRELGTIDVHVRVEARGASVWFAAEHPAARAALEQALPQLRERFAADGVALAQTQVAAQTAGWNYSGSQQQPTRTPRPFGRADDGDGGPESAELPSVAASRAITHLGLIDRYA